MSDNRIHPSQLGDWAGCPKRTWFALDNATGRDVESIAEWVGSAAHVQSAGRPLPSAPTGPALFDSLTPNMHVARLQADAITRVLEDELAMRGLLRAESELAVDTDRTYGTLDMVLRPDVPDRLRKIADLKTGQHVPDGVWLQLGGYFDAYNRSHPHLPADEVMVIHIPRAAPLEIRCENLVTRDGARCAEAALLFIDQVHDWMQTGTWRTVPPTPGQACYRCQVDEAGCAVKVIGACA